MHLPCLLAWQKHGDVVWLSCNVSGFAPLLLVLLLFWPVVAHLLLSWPVVAHLLLSWPVVAHLLLSWPVVAHLHRAASGCHHPPGLGKAGSSLAG